MKKTIFKLSALGTLLVPAMAFAQNFNYVDSWIGEGVKLLRLAITVITILMTIFFLYNVLRFIMNKEASKVADLRKAMINGLIGLFVSVAVWGIIGLAANITGVNTTNNSSSPTITCPPGLHPVNGYCS